VIREGCKVLDVAAKAHGFSLANFDAVAGCAKLGQLTLRKPKGVESLEPLKKMPALRSLTVSKDTFPAAELEGFDDKVKITQR